MITGDIQNPPSPLLIPISQTSCSSDTSNTTSNQDTLLDKQEDKSSIDYDKIKLYEKLAKIEHAGYFGIYHVSIKESQTVK